MKITLLTSGVDSLLFPEGPHPYPSTLIDVYNDHCGGLPTSHSHKTKCPDLTGS